MTAQTPENLIFEGETHKMCSIPLCWEKASMFGRGIAFSTGLRRGYIGTWEIVDDRLYLVDIEGSLADGTMADLETVFPGCGGRVFADWYSGTVRLPQGKLLQYVHLAFGSTYERDLLLEFDKGVLKSRRERVNDVPEMAIIPVGDPLQQEPEETEPETGLQILLKPFREICKWVAWEYTSARRTGAYRRISERKLRKWPDDLREIYEQAMPLSSFLEILYPIEDELKRLAKMPPGEEEREAQVKRLKKYVEYALNKFINKPLATMRRLKKALYSG